MLFIYICLGLIAAFFGSDMAIPFWPSVRSKQGEKIDNLVGLWNIKGARIRVALGHWTLTFFFIVSAIFNPYSYWLPLAIGHSIGQLTKFIWGRWLLRIGGKKLSNKK